MFKLSPDKWLIVCWVLGGILVLATIISFRLVYQYGRGRRMQRHVPASFSVNFSSPGVYSGAYDQKWRPRLGQALCVYKQNGDGVLIEEFHGLICRIVITNAQGDAVYQQYYKDTEGLYACCLDERPVTTAFRMGNVSLPVGEYRCELRVEQGCSAWLNGVCNVSVVNIPVPFGLFMQIFAVLGVVTAITGGFVLYYAQKRFRARQRC